MNSVRNLKRNSLLVVAFFIATFFTFATTNYEAKAKVDFSHTAKVDGIAYQHYRNTDDVTGVLSLFTVWLDSNGNLQRKDGWLYPNTNSFSINTENYGQELFKNFKGIDTSTCEPVITLPVPNINISKEDWQGFYKNFKGIDTINVSTAHPVITLPDLNISKEDYEKTKEELQKLFKNLDTSNTINRRHKKYFSPKLLTIPNTSKNNYSKIEKDCQKLLKQLETIEKDYSKLENEYLKIEKDLQKLLKQLETIKNFVVHTNENELIISNSKKGTVSITDIRTGNIILKDIEVSSTPVRVKLPAGVDTKSAYSITFTDAETGAQTTVISFPTPENIEFQKK
ncbi:MAG: hypothetical protein GX372_03670 [Ignavibacteria bacterium]|jgi:hypothetical protein|nr:hypothetical protein [Ignavibacteria bacterium]